MYYQLPNNFKEAAKEAAKEAVKEAVKEAAKEANIYDWYLKIITNF